MFHEAIGFLRVKQWYKNTLIFIPFIFGRMLFDFNAVLLTLAGFVLLSLVSSSSYIINDIKDIDKDRNHPEKKKRPLAAGKITIKKAFVISVVIFSLSLLAGYMINELFVLFLSALFISNMLYTFYLKHVVIIDIHVIATNYIIRVTSGILLLGLASPSPWVLLSVFMIALLLAISKRRSEAYILDKKKVQDKKVFEYYNEEFLNMLTNIIGGIVIFSYILYTFMIYETIYMMLSIPLVTIMVFRYLYFVSIGHKTARNAEMIFKDKMMLAFFSIWLLYSIFVIYFLST